MTVIAINNFSGIAPRNPARYLRDDQAQTALNCPAWVGPLRALTTHADTGYDFEKVGDVLSMYRFGMDVDSDVQYWFHWLSDVDVVKGFISGDTSERTFFTGDGVPKATDNALALTGGTNYPVAAYQLGLPEPTAALSVVAVGAPETGATTETRVYTYTLVNSWSEESAPYAAGATVDVLTGQTVTVTLPVPPSGNFNITKKRIYRSLQGSADASFLFVAEVSAATLSFNDTVLAYEGLGEEMPSLTWQPPPADLSGLIGLPGGVLAGFTGNDIYFSDPYHPFAFPVGYSQSVKYKIVGLGSIDTTVVVLTQGLPFFIQGSHPDSMVVIDADLHQACVSKRSILSMNGAVFYASPDGLVALAPGGSRVVTENLFDKAQWQTYFQPESIHGYQYEGMYIGFFDNGTTQGGFIFDPKSGAFIVHDVYATAGYSDLKNDTLYLGVGGGVMKWAEGGSNMTYTWRSKKFTHQNEKSFSCFRVLAETYPVTLKVYAAGSLIHTEPVADGEIKRLPAVDSKDWEIELSGTAEVYGVYLAESMDEISNV
jgi:hypothetical protein